MAQDNDTKKATIQVVTQYLKDLSFENPNAPESLVAGWGMPETQVQVSLSQQQLNDKLYESCINLRVEAKNKALDKMVFILDLQYAAAISLVDVAKEAIPAVLMVEVPKILFPFVRELVAKATNSGGYPPLYLAPINFEELYISEMKRIKAAQQGK